MISVFHGSERERVVSESQKHLSLLLSKNPLAQVINFEFGEGEAEKIKNLAATNSLFSESYIISIRYFNETALGRELFLNLIPHLTQSNHEIIILDGTLTKEPLTKLEETGAKISKHMKPAPTGYAVAREVKPVHQVFANYNIYRFSDAFGNHEKRQLWVEYHTAKEAGLPAEELFWKINWQLRQMLMVSKMKPDDKTDMKPYSISKAKTFLKKYTDKELLELSKKLICIYHDARRGLADFDTALERLILEI